MQSQLPAATATRFRWFRYRLRSLFVLTTLSALAVGVAAPFAAHRAEQQTLAALRKAGNLVVEGPLSIFL